MKLSLWSSCFENWEDKSLILSVQQVVHNTFLGLADMVYGLLLRYEIHET
jgi:hypothetical protein